MSLHLCLQTPDLWRETSLSNPQFNDFNPLWTCFHPSTGKKLWPDREYGLYLFFLSFDNWIPSFHDLTVKLSSQWLRSTSSRLRPSPQSDPPNNFAPTHSHFVASNDPPHLSDGQLPDEWQCWLGEKSAINLWAGAAWHWMYHSMSQVESSLHSYL